MYSRRPMGLDLAHGPLLPSPSSIHHSSPPDPSSLKDKDAPVPPSSFSLPLPLPPPLPRPSQPPPQLLKGEKALERPGRGLWPLDKNGVPVITPVQGPDLRSVAFYQSLLRHHPAYRHLLDTFLVPPFPPFMCPPPATILSDVPFAFCAAAGPPPPPPPFIPPAHTTMTTPSSVPEEERRRAAQLASLGRPGKGGTPSPNHSHSSDSFSSGGGERKTTPSDQPRKGCDGESADEENCAGCPMRSARTGDPKSDAGAMLSAEELVASITAIPDPYQQYGYGRKLFPCPQCRYTTDRRNNLKRHMLTMHQLSAKLLECCGLLFRTKAALREHALIFHYHGYTCFYCARRFCRKALLKRHLSVHNGQKEFLCNVCDYATSHKSNLERHRRVHVRQEDGSYEDGMMMMEEEDVKDTSGGHLSEDEISVCSHDEENEEINVHSD